jgi:fatty acid desaturase
MLSQFRKDPFYLSRYNYKSASCLFLINCLLFVLLDLNMETLLYLLPGIILLASPRLYFVLLAFGYLSGACFMGQDFSYLYLLGIPAGIILTFPVTAFIHSASHNSIRPKWLNRPVGELMGLAQLSGLPAWTVIHVVHHTYPDDPEMDPHAPGSMSYWQFAVSMRDSIANSFVKYFLNVHGNNSESKSALKQFAISTKLDTLMKIFFWYLLLGPQVFTFSFVFSVLFKMMHFAWFNYVTHQPENGKVVIRNKSALLYKIVNLIAFGLYYHDNHHRVPSLFNPQKLKESDGISIAS